MVTALKLVPRIAPPAVVSGSDRVDDGQSLVDQSSVDQVGGDLVFDPAPDLVGVRKRVTRPTPVRPGTGQETAIVVESVGALAALVGRQVGAKIVMENRFQSQANPVRASPFSDTR